MTSDLATVFLRNFRPSVFHVCFRPWFATKMLIPNTSGYCTIVTLDEFKSVETYWIALYIDNYNITYYDSFGFEHIPKEMKKFIGNKNLSFYRIQPYDLITCGYLCIGFIDFMLKDKKVCLIIQIYFLLMIKKRMVKWYIYIYIIIFRYLW